MKVPYKWMLEYVDLDENINDVADALTLSGSKAEEVIETGKEISNVITGKIEKIDVHPDAEKLIVCQINVGLDENIQIVTGAKNVSEGDIVPVAMHKSTLPGGVSIKKGKLRGVESNGMLCSEEELAIPVDEPVHGIMILDKDTPIGADIKEVLGLNGGIIDFEITSNRSDCFGVYGIAREAAATFGKPLKELDLSYKEDKDTIKHYLDVKVSDSLCRRYMAKMVKNVKVGPSPAWLKANLEEAGVRSINNIVDITNYVMIELGQPMHAFDYNFISDSKIEVRRANDAEKFTTLDEVERTLDSSMLVIADGEKSVAIAGVMGGMNSEVTEATQVIVLESANFDGTNVRLTSKKLALRTDASGKFEKDLDPNLCEIAINRACHLIELIGAGEVISDVIDVYGTKTDDVNLEVTPKWINGFLGTDISVERMKEILVSLGMEVDGEEVLNIKVPSFRQDIRIREDVAEEIVRIYGYDKIPSVKIKGEAVEAAWTIEQKLTKLVKETMIASGFYEALTYSFIAPKVFDSINVEKDSSLRNCVKISNPLGEDFSLMRTTTMPSMLDSLSRNYARDNKEALLFEVSKVYIPSEDTLPEEKLKLTIGMYGDVDFYELKGVVEVLLEKLSVPKFAFERESSNPSFHPGKTANLLVRNKPVGTFGELHPDVLENYGFENRVFFAELDLESIFEASKMDKKYKALPKFPAVTRDIAMLVNEDVTVGEIEAIIKKNGKAILEEVKLFDVYRGAQIPGGKKSVAYALVYRGENKTLKDEEVNKVHDGVVKALSEKLSAELR
ncbi:phenylalanine--tRNA ligase subunit beta [Clostridium cylindrosporum]|uniref:Phenylalanine--tRNA ligase beta subunit n=1 Tax=Clostridium cylindrosporum DSM 605 TaxID=1121307 RepID=A0A0J8D9E6_CLOCY|nr:phenylalanine--tRNA ligase subunit beta [Clostridium cylindrosporum]KMT22660.1 phenylalanine--tRNA ligase beta subunit [Clostridium cylindrosporum DSM 605]